MGRLSSGAASFFEASYPPSHQKRPVPRATVAPKLPFGGTRWDSKQGYSQPVLIEPAQVLARVLEDMSAGGEL